MDVDAVMEEPLPAPTGPTMFLGQPRAAQQAAPQAQLPPAAASAAGDAQPATSTPAAKVEPEAAMPQRAQPAPAATAAAQQQGMSRLDLETCLAMHSILAKYKEADPFRQPVDVEAFGIPDYYDVIKKPMDLKTAREKVSAAAAFLSSGVEHSALAAETLHVCTACEVSSMQSYSTPHVCCFCVQKCSHHLTSMVRD